MQQEDVIRMGRGADWASQVVKNPPANAGDARDANLIPDLGR